MIRLFYIEWLKVSRSRYFKWMVGLWLLSFLIVPLGIDQLFDFLERTGDFTTNDLGISPTDFPIFSHHDLWHNLSYAYKLTSIFLCIIIIVNVGQEWEEKTIRQNVIDGLSRNQYFFSKVILMLGFSLLSTFLLFALGTGLGMQYFDEFNFTTLTSNISFLFGYTLHLFLHLSIAMLFINLIRRVGLTILLFTVYMYIVEPLVLSGVFIYMREAKEMHDYSVYLPFNSSWNLVPFPFGKYFLSYVSDTMNWVSIGIASIWLVIILFINSILTTRRDLR